MEISDCMKKKVFSAKQDMSIIDAALLMVHHHIGSLPIIDNESKYIGLVRMRDIITLAMPDFVSFIQNVDFVHDFGAIEENQPDQDELAKPVTQIMIEPICVEDTSGLLRAISLLQEYKLNDLPVVDSNMHLVGIASHVDIGVTIISNWNLTVS